MTATSLLPPPPPAPVADEPATERPRTALAVLAIIGVVAALVFGLLWITASANLDDAEQERDLALSERDAATAFGIELSNELQSTRNQLADAEAALSAAAPSESSTADPSEISDLEANVERLTAEVDRLTTENETLQADLEAARSSSATTVAAETTVAPKTTDAPETTIAAPPTAAPTEAVLPSTLEIGAWLSSLYRSSVLGPGQNECLGRAVLDDLGPDQVSGILASGGDAADNDVLIASLRVAASACGIDPSAIFG